MGEIIAGFIMIVIGAVITLKSEALFHFVGRIAWAEEHLGVEGGSRVFIKLIGIGLIVLGILVGTGTFGDIITDIFSSGGRIGG
ncbi:MAG: hypothetical protein A3F54_02605 [Candidatus Kerfeldbacteria bacterium RIFCSPHIGHO2_12_FULL_48_17]|uniref:Uncharacterized protein n=1 Tax=Candidatus Kerfeldbacteria bacterium RIFCSPHIGHO2_12_FULL_48_17 TaxID=1798542 RepID=A0A1G2AX32_9BACT|nr:MAG: hypothetical protein A3F54_02605 [Candidatus Kerfeldbacteria bacterium RIFCSPHIGHO2_12_FULL_48_17]